jgi:phosphatidylserine/phosphatidylglycerophosphate/cardiolipin synthase-like enzyme
VALRLALFLGTVALVLPDSLAAATAEIHYAPAENLEVVDAREIQQAALSIDMAAYVLSDGRIIEALTEAAERDVAVRLYFDKSQFSQHGLQYGAPIEALLAHPNVQARVKGEGVLMHLKAYAVDGKILRTGSGNFSRPGLAQQDNDLILITDQATVDAFEINFDRIWSRAQNIDALETPERPGLDVSRSAYGRSDWRSPSGENR